MKLPLHCDIPRAYLGQVDSSPELTYIFQWPSSSENLQWNRLDNPIIYERERNQLVNGLQVYSLSHL